MISMPGFSFSGQRYVYNAKLLHENWGVGKVGLSSAKALKDVVVPAKSGQSEGMQ